MKIRVQRFVKVWVEERYEVENISEDIIDNIIDCVKEPYDINVLWETQEDLGPIDIYDEDGNIING